MFDTKAGTLDKLSKKGHAVPPFHCFTVGEWRLGHEPILQRLSELGIAADGDKLAVRSSSLAEDGKENSLAGAFCSLLDVPSDDAEELTRAIDQVAGRLREPQDQVLVQKMVRDVIMSGVLTTRTLVNGSPYYVINYDDVSGRTDTVTGGKGAVKTVYIYRGVKVDYFDSPRLRAVVNLAKRLEAEFTDAPLDIEFAVDRGLDVHLLQVRRICSARHWHDDTGNAVDGHIAQVANFIREVTQPRRGLYGERTILGLMPDWNPAEMIGTSPRPLSLSLYRELITRRTWSAAREKMGYRPLPPVELMLSVAGRPYIDVRASLNSFLPEHLSDPVAERLVNAWLGRLDAHPDLHDKIEFEIAHTVMEPGFAQSFRKRYPQVLSDSQFAEYHARLQRLTAKALARDSSLAWAMHAVADLKNRQDRDLYAELAAARHMAPFDITDAISEAVELCRQLGTLPFAVIARHAFVAESIFRALIRGEALRGGRAAEFKQSVRTVAGDLTADFRQVLSGELSRDEFLFQYGHLRPGTYDILSPSYRDRKELFAVESVPTAAGEARDFTPTPEEQRAAGRLLAEIDSELDLPRFLEYAAAAISGREYVKFVFTRHVSHILELLTIWGEKMALSREDLSMIPLGDVLETLHKPLPLEGATFFRRRIDIHREEYRLGLLFEMAYLIRSERDVFIVPQHRSAPNFTTAKRLIAPVAYLEAHSTAEPSLAGRIVCIDSADPGYDWIFTRNPAGLVTKFGGTNSHMAIRCAEYALPAAIGCGELLFEQIKKAGRCILDCGARSLVPLPSGEG